MRKRNYSLFLLIISIFSLKGQVAPVKDLHENPPRVWALTNGNVYIEPNKLIKAATIILRDGIIEAVGTDPDIPSDATEIDLNGNTVYAGFIESWLEIPDPDTIRAARDHWNKQVRADRVVFDSYNPDDKDVQQLRELGFTTAHLIPKDGIFRGQSSLAQLTDKPVALKTTVAQVVDFNFGGWGSNAYPNSLLGCIALIRQTFLDADWYTKATAIFSEYPEDNEPVEEDLALDALAKARRQKYPFIFNTSDELYALRAGSITREFGLELWLKGSGYEYRRLNAIKTLNPFIILPVNYPGKPDVSNPYQALQYTTEQLKHWDLAPDNAAKLVAAGIPIAFTSAELKNRSDFRKRLTKSIQRGLSPEIALAALTTVPAEKMGVGHFVGKIQAGYQANLVIVDGDYFNYQDPIRSVWIGGNEYPVKPAPIVDPSGKWELELPETTWRLSFKKSGSRWKGSLEYDSLAFALKDVTVDADRVTWILKTDTLGFAGSTRFTGHLEDSTASGKVFFASGAIESWTGKRIEFHEKTKADTLRPESPSALTVVYPDGAFGLEEPPKKPFAVLVDDATIWTCGPKGILKGWDILFVDGKVKKIARGISVPRGAALIIDGRGKHVTPGLIDAHNHSAAASINEGTQSVTAEVRIRDVLNSDDIAIYRELAGGLTVANVLHGSANTIGGQNAVIKLRWGVKPGDLIFRKAPPGIKFALGENVKQSNWGERYRTRYPQTRMGVEQVLRDAFTAARDYRKNWETYYRDVTLRKTKIPPRKDLELEALVEVLEGKRLVHCHSYRQDEILMLTRVAEDFGFTVGTFQHVLEGYKVADRIADHGAGASTFSDWWAYKFEVIDAIPYNGALMTRVGVTTSFNSDSNELARHLNTEAAKAVKYGGLSEEEALKLVTINPARQLKIDRWVGSLEVGKDADFVIWSDNPLSTYAVCEQTWIDGRLYFSIERDKELRQRDKRIRNELIQKILATGDDGSPAMLPSSDGNSHGYSCYFGDEQATGEGGAR